MPDRCLPILRSSPRRNDGSQGQQCGPLGTGVSDAAETPFAEYYRSAFRQDLIAVIAGAPEPCHSIAREGEVVIQPMALTYLNPVIKAWSEARRTNFALSLFLTVLSDQVCFTHFREEYGRFRQLTMSPKLKGDCPGGCANHAHPRWIFAVIGRSSYSLQRGHPKPPPVELYATTSAMRQEVIAFVAEHLRGVDPEEFWKRCEAEFPERDPGAAMLHLLPG